MESKTSVQLVIISVRSGDVIAEATLTCDPVDGSHPCAAAACEQLIEANCKIEDIPEQPGPCPRIFDPVILRAEGVCGGSPIEPFEKEFPNCCEGIRATGGVLFNFIDCPGIEPCSESY